MPAKRKPPRDPSLPTRFVIYTRLSKAKAAGTGTDLAHDTQEASCRRKVAAHGGVVVRVFGDTVSGDRLDRDGLWEAVKAIEAGEADALITHSIDRLGRDQEQQGVIYYAIRQARGEYVSATEDFGNDPVGRHIRATYGFAAEVELMKIRERTGRALNARFAQAKKLKPGPHPIYGYAKVGSGADATYVEDPIAALVVRRIWSEAAAGASRNRIANGLNADGVASPSGSAWGSSGVGIVLARDVYFTGQLECWRTKTVREDIGTKPRREYRPADERYRVAGFPILVDPEVAARARQAATRNRWNGRRVAVDPAVGLLRYGFCRCSGCGRAMAYQYDAGSVALYSCTAPKTPTFRCPKRVGIAIDKVDGPLWAWVEVLLSNPNGWGSFLRVDEPEPVDPALVAALTAAESRVADLTVRVGGLLDNLSLVSGAAAQVAAAKVNALSDELAKATQTRDRLAAEAATKARPPRATVIPVGVAAEVADRAIRAMWQADPEPARTAMLRRLVIESPEGIDARDFDSDAEPVEATPDLIAEGWFVEDVVEVAIPDSWAAKRAALSVLGVRVTVNRRGQPTRWEATAAAPVAWAANGAATTRAHLVATTPT